MSVIRTLSAIILLALEFLSVATSRMVKDNIRTVVTDVTITFCPAADPPPTSEIDSQQWHCIEKELYLHTAHESAWLHLEKKEEKDLTADDVVLTEIRVAELPSSSNTDQSWENRPGGILLLRKKYTGNIEQAVSGLDVLFGVDAVDPRPQWVLMPTPLQLNAQPGVPVARLSVRRGWPRPRPSDPETALRIRDDGTFKIVQVSDTHMVTGVGVCKDPIDADGQHLPESEADPLTVDFLGRVLDIEKPDLVILSGDQVHHDALDSQSALFKVVTLLIKRSIPYAAVFGNHDDEGAYALSRTAQMSLLQDLPLSLCQPGPKYVDGVGNYYLQVFDHAPSKLPLLTLYLLDSHGQISTEVQDPDYEPIKQSQIDWFRSTSQELRKAREKDNNHNRFHSSLAFLHIPLPEYANSDLPIMGGQRREPTEGPSVNSHLYEALANEGIAAVGCGHDHVNDFCGLLPQQGQQDGNKTSQLGPWLCYAGGSGFGGYCSYGENRYHRRMRVWEFHTKTGVIRTWKRVEYAEDRIDELELVESGQVVAPLEMKNAGTSDMAAQAVL